MTQLVDYRHRAPDSCRGPRGDIRQVKVPAYYPESLAGFDYATIAYSG
jgi:hypothetical protein